MGKNISALGACKVISLLVIVTGMALFSSFYLQNPIPILLGCLLTFMIAEDWLDQNIDIRLLAVMTALLFYGVADRKAFIIQYIFLLVLFRVLFLWLMRFEERLKNKKAGETDNRLQTGFLPVFALSFCIVFTLPFTGEKALACFSDIRLGFEIFSMQISMYPQILWAVFAALVGLLLLGERRRRIKAKEMDEIWPFGDGDVWFLAAWGAAIDTGIFFVIFFLSQFVLLIMYAGKYFLGGEFQHE